MLKKSRFRVGEESWIYLRDKLNRNLLIPYCLTGKLLTYTFEKQDPRLGTRTGNIYAISCNLWKRPFFLVSVPASCGLLRDGIGIRGNVCIELKVKPRLPPQAAASCSLEC
ncbi:hypothetical protein QQP08_015718 [Theobroma cacao]|nr:hypothetical protein QQP08_015718 [Theobroma cacao]